MFLIHRATSAILHCTTYQNVATFVRLSVWIYSGMYAFHHAIINTGSSGNASDLRCWSCQLWFWPGIVVRRFFWLSSYLQEKTFMLTQSGYDHFSHTAHIYRKQPQSRVIGRYYNVFQYPVKYKPLRKYRCLLHEFRLALELLVSDVSYILPSGVLL